MELCFIEHMIQSKRDVFSIFTLLIIYCVNIYIFLQNIHFDKCVKFCVDS